VAEERYKLYSSAWHRIHEAIDSRFFLEAISLTESLISDRLESRLSYLRGADFGFKTIGQLIDEASRIETDPELLDLITTELDSWRKARNKAAHEMVKIEAGQSLSWEERLAHNESIAREGFRMLGLVGGRVNALQDHSV
jgi:hypothetical protein